MLRLIYLVLFIFLGYKVWKWVSKSLVSSGPDTMIRGNNEKIAVNDLVKDPVCGTYVPLKSAVSAIRDGKTVYFCSENCRKTYLNE